MTKEQFEFLKQYEDRLLSATRSNWARNIQTKDIATIVEIYKDLSGNKNYHTNINCGGCVLKLLKTVYPFYNEYIENENRKTEDVQEGDNISIENGETKLRVETPKRGRPKKTNKKSDSGEV